MSRNNVNIDTNTLNYYNSTFVNTGISTVSASLKETRSSPILLNPSEWLMSVVRFDVDSSEIPLNVPLMQVDPITGIPSQTATQSFVTLKYNNNFYTQNVVYVPELLTSNYNFPVIFFYQKWLDYVNVALNLAFVATGVVGFPPQFIYNPLTQLIDLYVDTNFLPGGPNHIDILINNPLIIYLYNFEYSINSNPLYRFQFLITNTNTVLLPAPGARQNLPLSVQTGVTNKITQSIVSVNHWSSLRSIILVGNGMPFRNESITAKPTLSSNFDSSNSFAILTDFLIDFNLLNDRFVLEYLPQAQYRYLDLIGDSPMNSINIDIYWTTFTGDIFPVFLSPGGGMSIKFLFQKKNLLLPK